MFSFRLADDELEMFFAAALVGGLQVSAWVRQRLRSAALKELNDAGKPFQIAEAKP